MLAGFVDNFEAEKTRIEERLDNVVDVATTGRQHFWLDRYHARILATLNSKRLMPLGHVEKIVALASDLGREDLGLAPAVLDELQGSLTKVLHSAWAVNFNIGVRSFEKQHIKGVHNLINLCLSTSASQPAQFFFCSSISAAAGTPLPAMIDETPLSKLEQAQSMGYARSKLVAEKIIEEAARSTGMVAKVLRVGQIIGDTSHGIWNTTEAIPLMIQSAVTMGCLPALGEVCSPLLTTPHFHPTNSFAQTPSWLPVDLVAASILDLCKLSDTSNNDNRDLHDPSIVYHVQNPRTFHWTNDLLPALKHAGLEFDIVPQREWIRRLRESEPDPAKNPTRKLLEFFAEKYDHDGLGREGLGFRTEKTELASPSLRGGVDVVGSGLMGKIVKEWLSVWT